MAQSDPQFGPYELVKRLGVGGMAETFLAIRRGPGGFEQRVCVKRILSPFELDPEFVRLFLEEARVSARLRHVSIAQVLDFGVVDGAHFLTLELIEGMDLRALLQALGHRDETMAWELVSYLAFELASALDFAHSSDEGIVHRDVSPSNVLLSRVGEVKLADFGIAKAISQPGVTRSGVVKGKVPYMAPEYARKGLFDARSDLFSLGVTLYESLAGQRPFDGITDLDTIERSTNGTHVPLEEIAKGAPPALVAAIERSIAPQPEDRFQSAADFLDALVSVAPPPTARRTMGELVRRMVQATNETDTQQTEAIDAHGETLLATPRGTVVLREAGRKTPAPDVRAANAAEPTKTRTPSGRKRGKTPPTADGTPAEETEANAVVPLATGEHYDTDMERSVRSGGRKRVLSIALAVLAIGAAAMIVLFAVPWNRGNEGDGAPHLSRPSSVPMPAPIHKNIERRTPVAQEATNPAANDPTSLPTLGAALQQEATSPIRTTPEQPQATEPTEGATDSSREREETKGRSGEAQSAYIEVAVVPFGDVWLNGRMIGPSPVTLRVPPGRHSVATGESRPERSTAVRVRPGERRRIVIR